MSIPQTARENPGYALLGGPALGVVAFLVGAQFAGTAAGAASAVAAYALGWALTARRSEREPRPSASDSDGERDRRDREAEARKGSYGGSGGG